MTSLTGRRRLPGRELPLALRPPVSARLGPRATVWAVIAGERGGYLVTTERELLHVDGGRVAASWRLADLDDIRPVGGLRAILVRRRDGAGGSLTFPVSAAHPEAIQAITVLELLIVQASRRDRATSREA